MKHCPKCTREYADETLNFCLDDGEWLLSAAGGQPGDEPATAVLHSTDATGDAATRLQVDATTGAKAEPRTSLGESTERQSLSALPPPRPPKRRPPLLWQEGSSAEPQEGSRAKPLAAFIVAVLILVGGFFGYRYFSTVSSKQIGSIAVMPFVNQSGDADVEYLSDGMTETLISSLTQLPDLAVKPRSSVFRYKGKDTDTKTIGKDLSVAAILNGTVLQRGSDMTLHVELIDTATETLIWSRDYKQPIASLAALQSEITRDVVDKLRVKLNSTDQQKLARNYTENGEAYQLYLKGRSFWNKQTNRDVEISIDYFQKAIAIDPNYALAYAGLADAYSLAILGASRERMAQAREAAKKAVLLDNDLAEAHASLGRILSVDDYDFAGAEREMRRAIELNPNYGIGHHFLGDLLSLMGRYEEAFSENRRAIELEPFSAVFITGYGGSLLRARRYDEAATQLHKALELDPNFWGAYGRLSIIAEVTGRYAEAVELRSKIFEANGDARSAALIRESFAKGGWEGYNRYMKEGPPNVNFYSVAVAFTNLGEKDKAFGALNKSFEDHQIALVQFLNNDPRLDPLRDDPRFHDLMKRIGFEK